MPAEVIGWDIGGAHLKAAKVDPTGRVCYVRQVPCPVWRGLAELDRALEAVLSDVGCAEHHAFTMTAECADLFADRAAGVATLCAWAVERYANAGVLVFDRCTGLIAPERAARRVQSVASANWAATATWLSARVPDAIVVDVGSTTIDLVPITQGRCTATAAGDHARLIARELVYSGVVRKPVMALAQSVTLDGHDVPLCAEVFATTGDVYRLLGRLPADYDHADTADGRGRSDRESAARLARMVGLDAAEAGDALVLELARQLAARQADTLARAWEALAARHPPLARAPIVALGAGSFLAKDLAARVGVPLLPFASVVPAMPGDAGLARGINLAGPAVAVALLAHADLAHRQATSAQTGACFAIAETSSPDADRPSGPPQTRVEFAPCSPMPKESSRRDGCLSNDQDTRGQAASSSPLSGNSSLDVDLLSGPPGTRGQAAACSPIPKESSRRDGFLSSSQEGEPCGW